MVIGELLSPTQIKNKPQKSNRFSFVMTLQHFLITTFIFLIIFCTLGLPFTKWGFKTDDWGNVYHSILSSWSDFTHLFIEGNSEQVYHPSNVPPAPQAFFQGLYRPLSFVYYFIQHCIFGIHPYGYFLVTIGLHALNAVLLYLLLCTLAPSWAACTAALLFGFHPSLGSWIGWTSAQTYFIELFILLILLLCVYQYIRTKHRWLYVLACVLLAMNLLLKEQTIFLPILMTAVWRYINPLGFWLVAASYLWLRLQLYPLTASTGTLTFEPTWHSFITRISSRVFDFVSYANDMIGLCWLPSGNQMLKGSIIFFVIVSLCYGFFHNTRKRWVLFCFLGMILSSWPALLMHYQPRYIYMAIPWFLAAMLLMVPTNLSQRMRVYVLCFCTLLIGSNASYLIYQLHRREKVLHTITSALNALVADQATAGRTLCFLALPPRWFAQGTTQAVWMLRKNDTQQAYQFDIRIEPIDGNLPDNFLVITRSNNTFTFTTTNPDLLWFPTKNGAREKSITLIIEDKYLHDDPLFIAWDYKHQAFRIVPL